MLESGAGLKHNYSEIDFDVVHGFLFSGIKSLNPESVYMHYIGSQKGGVMYGMYNNQSRGKPYYSGTISVANETAEATCQNGYSAGTRASTRRTWRLVRRPLPSVVPPRQHYRGAIA